MTTSTCQTFICVSLTVVCCSASCIKRSPLLKNVLMEISPCHTQYHQLNIPSRVLSDGAAGSTSTQLPEVVTNPHGFPAVFAGDSVYVSTNSFRDRRGCVTADMLPAGVNSSDLTAAGFTGDFLLLVFGTQLVRLRTTQLLRWLHGERSRHAVHVVHLSSRALPVTHVSTTPCCAAGKWCSRVNRHVVVYSFNDGGNLRAQLHASVDQAATFTALHVHLKAGSEPVLFAQYPTEEYSALFHNYAGRGYVLRMDHECRRNVTSCSHKSMLVSDEPLSTVALQRDMLMATMLVTRAGRLSVSGRADSHFEPTAVLSAATLQHLGASAGAKLPVKAFAGDGVRWLVVDADDNVFLGSAQPVWESLVYRFRLDEAAADPLPSSAGPRPSGPQAGSTTAPATTASKSAAGRAAGKAGTSHRRHQTFVLRGRTLEVVSLTEEGASGGLVEASRRLSLSPYLAKLDADCETFRLAVVLLSRAEPVVDKNDTLQLRVHVNAAEQVSMRPLVLLSTPMLVSRMRLLSSGFEPDGTVSSAWSVEVSSHPESRRRPYMARLHLAQMRVTTTAAGAECPPRRPRPVAVLVGCNPWLRLRALNKRTEPATCRHLMSKGLLIVSSPERDPLLRHQRRARGEDAVRLKGGVWHVHWDPDWGCPLLSSDKAQFSPVLVVEDRERSWPLELATVVFDIHGLRDFEFGLSAADAGCLRTDLPEAVSWRRSSDLLRPAAGADFDPFAVLNTSSYVSCNRSDPLPLHHVRDEALSELPAAQVGFEIFGLPGHDNSILWGDSSEIHVFNFRVVDPMFTFCDLSLTVPVFFMHAADVSQHTKLTILLVGIGLGLLAVVVAHCSRQITQRVRQEKREQMEQLLQAADAFVAGDGEPLPIGL